MSSQTARNVLRNLLNTDIAKDESIKTALEIAIEDMDKRMINEWIKNDYDLELRVYLGYSKEEYDKYIMGISK